VELPASGVDPAAVGVEGNLDPETGSRNCGNWVYSRNETCVTGFAGSGW